MSATLSVNAFPSLIWTWRVAFDWVEHFGLPADLTDSAQTNTIKDAIFASSFVGSFRHARTAETREHRCSAIADDVRSPSPERRFQLQRFPRQGRIQVRVRRYRATHFFIEGTTEEIILRPQAAEARRQVAFGVAVVDQNRAAVTDSPLPVPFPYAPGHR